MRLFPAWSVGLGVLATVLAMGGCRESSVDATPTSIVDTDAGRVATTDPRWIHRDPVNPNPVAVVFVHGLFGDTLGTWTHANGRSLPDYLHEDPVIGNQVDVYAFGFTSDMIGGGSLKIGEAAVKLHEYLQVDGVDQYARIVFVAHSMGGLVVMRELVSRADILAKVPLIVLYATPHEGSQITRIASHVVANDAVRQMFPVDANDYLQQLNEDWSNMKAASRAPTVVCAYEKKATGNVMIVQWSSSTRNCDGLSAGVEDSDHISIVKPDRSRHISVVVLLNAIRNHVMPLLQEEAWDTPDLDRSGDPWRFKITNAGGKNRMVLANRSGVRSSYSLRVDDANSIFAAPTEMPRPVGAGVEASAYLIPLTPLQETYQLKLGLGALPERVVVAWIPDMDAARRQRAGLEAATAEVINAWLASGPNAEQFQQLSVEAQEEQLATLAEASVAARNPDLAPEARLVLAADSLAALNLSGGSARALERLAREHPVAAQTGGVQHLASVVSARTSGSREPAAEGVQRVPLQDAVQPVDLTATNPTQRLQLTELAENLQNAEATRADASVLKGDLLLLEGDTAGAELQYMRAGELEDSPLIRKRLERVRVRD